ncbi:Nn.00g040410.m01.CDS01 [Neocucurbitaria sp. VM-36]
MSYYNDPSWPAPAPGRQSSWEQPQPPSRSGTGHSVYNGGGAPIHMDIGASSTVNRDEASAFSSQFDEVERATENLAKSGKSFGPGFPPTPVSGNRRESMPMMGGGPRQYPEYEQRMGGPGPQRHHSVSEYDGSRSHSASNVQGFYQNQRYAPRPNDADQMAQAKRRMAAQRERELRNYHQEQQYHRNVSGSKSDRSMSPNAMNEDERRELIARQHRALYGETSTLYNNNPTSSQDVRVQTSGAGRGTSPLAFDPFGMQAQNASGDAAVQMPPRGDKDAAGGAQEARANSNQSPSSNQNPAFSLFDAQQANRTSNSSPGGSPPISGPKSNGSGVAPIGTRPQNQNLHQPAGAPLGKRATSPLPSPLGYNSYNASEQKQNSAATTSASLNPSSTVTEKGVGIWNNGPWGNTPNQGVQASVWG